MTDENRKLLARILRAVAAELDPSAAAKMPMPDDPPRNPPGGG